MALWRASALFPLVVVAAYGWNVWWMAYVGVAGELLAIAYVYGRLGRIHDAFRTGQSRALLFLVLTGATAILVDHSMAGDAFLQRFAATCVMCAVALGAAAFVFPALRGQALRMVRGKLDSDKNK